MDHSDLATSSSSSPKTLTLIFSSPSITMAAAAAAISTPDHRCSSEHTAATAVHLRPPQFAHLPPPRLRLLRASIFSRGHHCNSADGHSRRTPPRAHHHLLHSRNLLQLAANLHASSRNHHEQQQKRRSHHHSRSFRHTPQQQQQCHHAPAQATTTAASPPSSNRNRVGMHLYHEHSFQTTHHDEAFLRHLHQRFYTAQPRRKSSPEQPHVGAAAVTREGEECESETLISGERICTATCQRLIGQSNW